MFGHTGKHGLIRKIRLISKLMTSQPVKQTIATYILPNIPTSKGNQSMKCGKSIKYKKVFLEKSYTKCG